MAISSTFKDRLEQMEDTRNQRLSLLQAEKELQHNKSQTLASKLSGIRHIEQRCLKLEHKVVSQQLIISSIKSQLDHLDSVYVDQIQQFRVLKSEVENLEELEKETDRYFALKARDIDEFRVRAEIFATECQRRVEELRNRVNELNSSFIQLQHSAGCSNNSDLAAAEMRKSELQAIKDNLDRRLASNYKTRAQLQKQLKSMLISQKEQRKPSKMLLIPFYGGHLEGAHDVFDHTSHDFLDVPYLHPGVAIHPMFIILLQQLATRMYLLAVRLDLMLPLLFHQAHFWDKLPITF